MAPQYGFVGSIGFVVGIGVVVVDTVVDMVVVGIVVGRVVVGIVAGIVVGMAAGVVGIVVGVGDIEQKWKRKCMFHKGSHSWPEKLEECVVSAHVILHTLNIEPTQTHSQTCMRHKPT